MGVAHLPDGEVRTRLLEDTGGDAPDSLIAELAVRSPQPDPERLGAQVRLTGPRWLRYPKPRDCL